MSKLQNLQRRLSKGISGWLLYEFSCNRGDLFNEKYLSYPLGGIITNLTMYQTSSEVNHPKITIGSVGRPLQVDFVIWDKYKTQEWFYAFESKWIGNTEIKITDILWDLIRLQNIFDEHPKVKCYFVLAGFDSKIKTLFAKYDILSLNKTFGKNFITSNNTTLKFHLNYLDSTSKNYINSKIEQYKNFKLYSVIECVSPHFYPNGNENNNMTFSTCAFEILKPNSSLKIQSL